MESFSAAECTPVSDNPSACLEFGRQLGSRIAVASASCVSRCSVQSRSRSCPFLPIQLSPFPDAGVAWTRDEAPNLQLIRNSTGRVPVLSTGLSARMNLFGAMVLEICYAYPFQRPSKGAHFGSSCSRVGNTRCP